MNIEEERKAFERQENAMFLVTKKVTILLACKIAGQAGLLPKSMLLKWLSQLLKLYAQLAFARVTLGLFRFLKVKHLTAFLRTLQLKKTLKLGRVIVVIG